MKNFSKYAALVVSTALVAGAANADTITSSTYPGHGVAQSNEFLFLDIYNHNTGLWSGEDGFVGDGQTDLSFGENPGSDPSARFGAVSNQDFGDEEVSFRVVTDSNFSLSDNASGAATDFSGMMSFGESDLDGKFLNGSGELYDSEGNGPLGNGGTGIFGFVMEVLDTSSTVEPCDSDSDVVCAVIYQFQPEPTILFPGFGIPMIPGQITLAQTEPQQLMEVQEEEEEGSISNVLAQFYGFIELSRGSVIGGTFGVNTTIGAAVALPPVSAVPLPASVLLLGAGVAGLGFAGRRRKKA